MFDRCPSEVQLTFLNSAVSRGEDCLWKWWEIESNQIKRMIDDEIVRIIVNVN